LIDFAQLKQILGFTVGMTKVKDCLPAMGTGALMGFMVGGGMAGGVS
jgi:hypothetical protein